MVGGGACDEVRESFVPLLDVLEYCKWDLGATGALF